ncbi:universal stress protein [Enterococcus saigonensis]|uniref:Universal stress protein n=1 Tax=Enterococcus saigonensis TaxID=1805431 RepID=A0A679IGK4_9ENTE|nr:universal stress protein [Enterococcus saigonensis]BCA85012.1 universal stress protein [Enterococcus saigonensis]
MTHYQNILVAIDGSKNAEKAFHEAVAFAKANNSKLYLAYIIDEASLSTSSFAVSKILKEEQGKAKMLLANLVELARKAGIENIAEILEVGEPKTYIATIIPTEYEIDLIVAGATGKGSLTREKVGSTIQYIVNHAPCTVLMVK